MKKLAKLFAKCTLKAFGIGITKYKSLEKLRQDSAELSRIKTTAAAAALRELDLLQRLNGDTSKLLLQCFGKSKSQLRQDLFVLSHLAFKRDGYFVEFGATNGFDLSNTYLMEKEFGWTGILAEPASCWHNALKRNRNCNITTDCVWKESNSTLTFNQVDAAELSTISTYSDCDNHSNARKKGRTYDVNTISLNDLLKRFNAPKHIDYLSVDTEGSEFQILSHFDFSQYSIEVITCEHNYTPMRGKIYALLTRQGYQRVFEDLSLFDDWYIKSAQPEP